MLRDQRRNGIKLCSVAFNSGSPVGSSPDVIKEVITAVALTIIGTIAMIPVVAAYNPNSVVVVGLNAALQKRFVLDACHPELIPGNVHRALFVEEGIGGKGQDVAVALSCLFPSITMSSDAEEERSPVEVQLVQFLGCGAEGDQVLNLMENRIPGLGHNGGAFTVRTASKLRTCTTIVGVDCATELVEPSGTVSSGELSSLLERIANDFRGKGVESSSCAGALCVMGSMPPGCPPSTYADIAERTVGSETIVLIDSVAGLGPLLGTLSSMKALGGRESRAARTVMLKVNISELCKLGKVSKMSGGTKEMATRAEVESAVTAFLGGNLNNDTVDYLAITDGAHPAHFVRVLRDGEGGERDMDDDASPRFRSWKIMVPDLKKDTKDGILYPIGAGDTVAAGTLAAWRHLCNANVARSDDGEVSHLNIFEGSRVDEVLRLKREEFLRSDDDDDTPLAFAFGLACASASCLRQENSVFGVDDALRLFKGMENPVHLATD